MPAESATSTAKHSIIELLVEHRNDYEMTTVEVAADITAVTGTLVTAGQLDAWEAGTGDPELGTLQAWARELNPYFPIVITHNRRELRAEAANPALQDLTDDDLYEPETAGGVREPKPGLSGTEETMRQIDRDPLARAAFEDASVRREVSTILGLDSSPLKLSQIPADQFTLHILRQPISSMPTILNTHWLGRAAKLTTRALIADLANVHGLVNATIYSGMLPPDGLNAVARDREIVFRPDDASRGQTELAWAGTKIIEEAHMFGPDEAAKLFQSGPAIGFRLAKAAEMREDFLILIHDTVRGWLPTEGTEGYAVLTGKQAIGEAPTQPVTTGPTPPAGPLRPANKIGTLHRLG